MTCLHQLIEFVNMQLAHRHDERPGESYVALDGKKAAGFKLWCFLGLCTETCRVVPQLAALHAHPL